MANVSWVKMQIDMFNHKKIRFIRKNIPEGNDVVLIWTMLICEAGKCNSDGYIHITENIPYTDESLANELDFPLNTVRLALDTFKKLNMVEIDGNGICLSGWSEYQSRDKLESIKEYNRLAKQKERERKKQKLLSCGQENVNDISMTSHKEVTQCHATDIEIELEKEINIYSQVIDFLNQKAGTNYKHNSKSNQRHISARLREGFTIEDFENVITTKFKQWAGTDMQKYLRPETLFGTKFESYLNECKLIETKPKDQYRRVD